MCPARVSVELRDGAARLIYAYKCVYDSLVARGHLAREVVVDARQPLGQDAKVVLDFGCARGKGTGHQ